MGLKGSVKDGKYGVSVELFLAYKSGNFTGPSALPVSELDKAKHQRDPRSLTQRMADYEKTIDSVFGARDGEPGDE